jgi:hypothetical protein
MPRPAPATRLSLAEISSVQQGVVTREQLREFGYGGDAVRAQVEARRWQAVTSRVVVLHNGPLTLPQRQWVAVLSQPGAALAGPTAAAAHGLQGFEDPVIHVLVRHESTSHPVRGVRVHRSRRFSPDDVHPARTVPTVRVERALVDAATWCPQPRKAAAFLAAGVQQRLTTAERLRPELLAATRARHRAFLLHVVGDIEGGAQSFGEIDFGRLARLAGVAPPKRQRFRYDRLGLRRYLDVEMAGYDVEIDGAVHLRPLRYWDDMDRQNDLIIVTGRPILRFSTVGIRLMPDRVIEQIAGADERFGRG